MKLIQKLNKLIMLKIVEIAFTIVFIIITIPMFLIRKNEDLELLSYILDSGLIYTNLIVESPVYDSSVLTDDEVNLTKLIVTNESLTNEEYALVLKISKQSKVDFNNLNIIINENEYALNSLINKEDSIDYYFILAKDNIKGENKEYLIKLYLNEKNSNKYENKEVNASFELIKSEYI